MNLKGTLFTYKSDAWIYFTNRDIGMQTNREFIICVSSCVYIYLGNGNVLAGVSCKENATVMCQD